MRFTWKILSILFVTSTAFRKSYVSAKTKLYLAKEGQTIVENSWIVVVEEQPQNDYPFDDIDIFSSHTPGVNYVIIKKYQSVFQGYEMEMTLEDAEIMSQNPNIQFIEQNVQAAASTTWGLDRIDQRGSSLDGSYIPGYEANGSGVTVYVVDTGIRISHIDFEGRASYGINTIDNNFNSDDCGGHGTHVAGTIGGKRWGVAKNVNLIAVKTLNCAGSGPWGGILEGLDWIKVNAVGPSNVVNMSLGGGFSASVNLAVRSLVQAGISVVVAAGNDNTDACRMSPASEPLAITVASSTHKDKKSWFSNYGTCVDIIAPGSDIESAWFTSNTASNSISGTSMAAPHVAGAVALLLGEDGNLNPSQISNILSTRSTKDRIKNMGESKNEFLYVGSFAPTTSPSFIPSSVPSVTSSPSVSMVPTGSNPPTKLVSDIIIDNGVIMLGLHNEGHLNVRGGLPDGHNPSLTTIGLRYFRDGGWYDAISHGAKVEGFGVSYEHSSDGTTFWGGASGSKGIRNVVPQLLATDGTKATTTVQVSNLEVKHEYKPSEDSPNLYEAKITYTNTSPSETLTNLRYRRMVDWDIPPSPYSECVSVIFQSPPRSLEYTTDNGFSSLSPLEDESNEGIEFSCPAGVGCPVYDSGPSDHGTLFQFLFKNDDDAPIELEPGESFSFDMFYGAAPGKAGAESVLNEVDAEIVSYGYSPSGDRCGIEIDGSPNVFLLAFRGVGGISVFKVFPSSAPSISSLPSHRPSTNPSYVPTSTPSISSLPSDRPSTNPSYIPSFEPTEKHSANPSYTPTIGSTVRPSTHPSYIPTFEPTERHPSYIPTITPPISSLPSHRPSTNPSYIPSFAPSISPLPSHIPSTNPSYIPSFEPTETHPSYKPTFEPTETSPPSHIPSKTLNPSQSFEPTIGDHHSSDPPTPSPSTSPSRDPSVNSNPIPCARFNLSIVTDEFPEEVSWILYNSCQESVEMSKPSGSYRLPNKKYIHEKCIPKAEYLLVIFDSAGDGICCDSGEGSFSISYEDTIISSREQTKSGEFEGSVASSFGNCMVLTDDDENTDNRKGSSAFITKNARKNFVIVSLTVLFIAANLL